ncbi:DUF885 family protein [Idiomarina loihiensis]|uniref:DUF885 family protein n=1 Tax=Idiomarina loihiensis TaxID=135577 RepID=UPI00384CE71A
MRYSIVALTVLGVLTACGQPQENNSGQHSQTAAEQPKQTEQSSQSETERLNQWFEEKYEEQLQQSPIQMTFLGRKDRYGDIDDMTVAAEKKQLEWLEGTVEELKANFDYDKLSLEAQTSYDVWVYQYEQAKRNAEFRGMDYVFDQMRGAHTFLSQFLINFHRVDDAEDMEAYISRLEGGATAIEQLLQRAEQQVENGVRAPRFAYEQIIKEAKEALGDKFDIRGFHDTVLGGGALPLRILERRVEQWVEEQKKA